MPELRDAARKDVEHVCRPHPARHPLNNLYRFVVQRLWERIRRLVGAPCPDVALGARQSPGAPLPGQRTTEQAANEHTALHGRDELLARVVRQVDAL
jgi:hypothetical protein